MDLDTLRPLIEQLLHHDRPRYQRLWAYYRNTLQLGPCPASASQIERPYYQAQEWGMPARITGLRPGGTTFEPKLLPGVSRKQVVIENDIAWRIDTMVDYLFGKSIVLESDAPDPDRRLFITELLRAILARHGGVLFLQQLALLGAVYGFVDVLVKLIPPGDDKPSAAGEAPAASSLQDLGSPASCNLPAPDATTASASRSDSEDASASETDPTPAGQVAAPAADDSPQPLTRAATPTSHASSQRHALIERLARSVRLEIVEPARALPVFCPTDSSLILAYGQCYSIPADTPAPKRSRKPLSLLERLFTTRPPAGSSAQKQVQVTELITPTCWKRYHDDVLVSAGINSLGRLPLVHIQNVPLPFEYPGLSDVEPLIPLQDELNTRLSDRAHRITFQSFKMYLGKGIENFLDMPVAPGRMWVTYNDDAEIVEFGGDANCPSEDAHIADLREAMDKTSSVTPIAAGAIKNRIGRLTSAAALRVTLLALLSKTDKKRTTYGAAIQQICELALAWLDRAGLFANTPDERPIQIHWPSPLPENDLEKLEEASAKLRVGVPREIVLRELGY
jgi:hypothetical protein